MRYGQVQFAPKRLRWGANAGEIGQGPIICVRQRHQFWPTGARGVKTLQIEPVPPRIETRQHGGIGAKSKRFKHADTDGRNAQRQGEPPCRGNRDPDAREIARPSAHGDRVQSVPRHACLCEHLFKQGQQTFGLTFRHLFVARDRNRAAHHQSAGHGRA